MSLRILYSFGDKVGAPGIGTTALHQVRALSAAGARVTLFCTTLHADVPAGVEVVETLRLRGRRVPHRMLGSQQRAFDHHDRRVAAWLARHASDVDAVHTWPSCGAATLRTARRSGVLGTREVPNTHTAHAYEQAAREAALVGVTEPRHSSHHLDRRRLQREEHEYALADLLMVPSDNVAQTFLDRGYAESRLARHRYGHDPERFHARGRDDGANRPFTAVFVGSLEPRKGLHYALDAWGTATLPEGSRLLVAGRIAGAYGDAVASGLAHPGVERLGFVDDVPALLRGADVLLLPSVEEGSALVTYEAQASGCVPLVSGAAGAVLPPSVADYVHPSRDLPTLIGHLETIAGDRDLLGRLRQDVIKAAPSLTWAAAGEQMVELLGRGRTGYPNRGMGEPRITV